MIVNAGNIPQRALPKTARVEGEPRLAKVRQNIRVGSVLRSTCSRGRRTSVVAGLEPRSRHRERESFVVVLVLMGRSSPPIGLLWRVVETLEPNTQNVRTKSECDELAWSKAKFRHVEASSSSWAASQVAHKCLRSPTVQNVTTTWQQNSRGSSLDTILDRTHGN